MPWPFNTTETDAHSYIEENEQKRKAENEEITAKKPAYIYHNVSTGDFGKPDYNTVEFGRGVEEGVKQWASGNNARGFHPSIVRSLIRTWSKSLIQKHAYLDSNLGSRYLRGSYVSPYPFTNTGPHFEFAKASENRSPREEGVLRGYNYVDNFLSDTLSGGGIGSSYKHFDDVNKARELLSANQEARKLVEGREDFSERLNFYGRLGLAKYRLRALGYKDMHRVPDDVLYDTLNKDYNLRDWLWQKPDMNNVRKILNGLVINDTQGYDSPVHQLT